MRRFSAILLLLLCCSPFIYGQKTRFGQAPPKAKQGVDYPIAVHIVATHIRKDCQSKSIISDPGYDCPDVVYVDAVLNGKKVELMGPNLQNLTISQGDFQSRLIKNAPNAAVIGQKYELLFPDKYVWRCIVTGISE